LTRKAHFFRIISLIIYPHIIRFHDLRIKGEYIDVQNWKLILKLKIFVIEVIYIYIYIYIYRHTHTQEKQIPMMGSRFSKKWFGTRTKLAAFYIIEYSLWMPRATPIDNCWGFFKQGQVALLVDYYFWNQTFLFQNITLLMFLILRPT